MAKNYVISTQFKILDMASNQLSKIGQAGQGAMSALKRDFAAAQISAKQLGATAKNTAKLVTGLAAGAVVAGIGVATREYIAFDKALTESSALFGDMVYGTEEFEKSLKALSEEAQRVGAVTEFTATDSAGALQKMAMAGLSSSQAIDLLMGTTNLATAAGTDLTTAVDIATDALGAFGMAASGENLGRISDVMAKTASSFNTDLEGMFEAMKYAGPSFTAAGQSVETFGAAVGVLANAGIKGSSAGTALNAVFTQMSNPKKIDALKAIGVAVQDSAGNFRGLTDIVADLEKALGGMGEVERLGTLNNIFDVRGAKAMNLLLQTGSASLKEYEATMYAAGGASEQMANIMRSSIKNQIEVLKSSLMGLGFRFVEAFKDKGSGALAGLINVVQSIDPQPIIATVDKMLSAVIGIAKFVAKALKVLKPFLPVVLGIVAAFKAYHAILIVAAIAQNIMNLAMAGNPIGIVIVAIGVLVGWLMNFKEINNVVGNFFSKVKDFAKNIGGFGGAIIQWFVSPFQLLFNLLKSVVGIFHAFIDGGVEAGFKQIGNAIVRFLLTPVMQLLNMMSVIPGVGGMFGNWRDGIDQWLESWSYTGRAEDAGVTNVAPVNANERAINSYSREESVSQSELNIMMAAGLTGELTGNAPNINLNIPSSGSFGGRGF